MLDKPKMFLMQYVENLEADQGENSSFNRVPLNADTVLGYSSRDETVSCRSSKNGPIYIQAFVEAMEEAKKKARNTMWSFTDILTTTNNKVSKMSTSTGKGQMSSFESTLRKKIVLGVGWD